MMGVGSYCALIDPARFGAYHDDGIYVSTAKALAEGDGYHIICLPYAPAQTKYPPFFPALLSLIWDVYPKFPENLTPMILLSVLSTVVFLALTWTYMRRHEYGSDWQVLAVIAMTALNWRTMILATSIYSEMLFSMLSLAALYIVEEHENSPRNLALGFTAGALIGLAFLTRSSGIALVISVSVYFISRRKWKNALLPVGVALLFVIGWTAWCYFNRSNDAGLNTPYYTSYLGHLRQVVSDSQMQSGSSLVAVLLNMAIVNIVGGIIIAGPLVTSGLSYNVFAGLGGVAITVLICGAFLTLWFIIMGFARTMTRRLRLLHIYVLTCLGLYLLWLPNVSYDRFLMPLLPFLQLFFAGEFGFAASLFKKGIKAQGGSKRISAILVAPVLLLIAGVILYGYGSGTLSTFSSLRTSHERAAADAEAIDWLKQYAEPETTLLCYRDPKYFLYTGRKAARFFPMTEGFSWEADEASMQKLTQAVFRIIEEAGARYIVLTSTDFELEDRPEQHRKILDKLIEGHSENFVLVFKSFDERSRIYRIDYPQK
jgi:hypothetical protein